MAYTLATWGDLQRDAYLQDLEDVLARIGEHPDIGRVRDDAGFDVRGYRVRQHIVYYRVASKKIRVLRILHQRMNPSHQHME